MRKTDQQMFLNKGLFSILQKMREFNFEVNDSKFVFLNGKIIEKVFEIH